MPVLTVSENTWPQPGFSRKRSIRPSSSTMTTPNSSGLSTLFSAIVTKASRSLWKSTILVRSKSVRASPLMTRKVSSSRFLAQPDGAGRADRRLLDRVVDVHAEAGAVAEVVADQPGQEGQRHDDVVDAVPLHQLEYVLDAGLVDDGHHGLRLIRGERAKTSALAASHDDCLHRDLLVSLPCARILTREEAGRTVEHHEKVSGAACAHVRAHAHHQRAQGAVAARHRLQLEDRLNRRTGQR